MFRFGTVWNSQSTASGNSFTKASTYIYCVYCLANQRLPVQGKLEDWALQHARACLLKPQT